MGWNGYGRERRTAGILFQRLFDMLDVFERIVEEKLDFGDVLQLVADALAQSPADEPVLLFEGLHHPGAALEAEGKVYNRRVAILDTIDNVACRTFTRTVFADSLLRVGSLRDTARQSDGKPGTSSPA